MPKFIALIPTDLHRSRLGLPSLLTREVRGKSVLQHVIERVTRVEGIEAIVLLHPEGQDPLALLSNSRSKVVAMADPGNLQDPRQAQRTAARKWSLQAWRGGLGGMTCYDELLPAAPMLRALREHQADVALLVGGDWPLVDPAWCRRLVTLHAEQPEAMQMTFTQAPPGLCGAVLGDKLIEQLVENPSATIGQLLGYIPSRPQADPIGRDVCVQIPGAVRSCARRFIYDTPRTAAMIDAIASRLGEAFEYADASRVTDTILDLERTPAACDFAPLPQQITIELTPQRHASGPIVPQHYVQMNRPPMSVDAALRVIEQAGRASDVALTFGGLGDALLHQEWDRLVAAAHAAGVLGIGIETDLLVPKETLDRLLELPIDVIGIRLNADRAAVYQKAMGVDRFPSVIGALQYLYEQRGNRTGRVPGVPWLVPRMVKTSETLEDMESFFDKWIHYLGHAVIEPSTSGCGLMPELSSVQMEPPRRRACRQVAGRMTVHSDGIVAQCDQDWLAKVPGGDTAGQSLAKIWESMRNVRDKHDAGRWNELELCGGCKEWHRP